MPFVTVSSVVKSPSFEHQYRIKKIVEHRDGLKSSYDLTMMTRIASNKLSTLKLFEWTIPMCAEL